MVQPGWHCPPPPRRPEAPHPRTAAPTKPTPARPPPAHASRTLLAARRLQIGGIEFEDYRMQREEWAELKPAMPMGQVPVLEVGGCW